MLALAFLFVIIIGLLWLIVRLLQRYFALHIELDEKDHPDELLHQLRKQVKSNTRKKKVKEINALIRQRLVEFDKKFPPLDAEMDGPETLIIAFKKLIRSSLNMLKERR